MYKHISMFRFRDRTNLEAVRAEFKAQLLEFPAHIPSIADCQVIENILAQPEVPDAAPLLFCDLVQILSFRTAQELAAYPHDPHHMAQVQATDHLVERVCIIDFKTPEG